MQDTQTDTPTLYEIMGGAERLRALVDRFYDLMQLEPEFANIHVMHPVPNDSSRDKLFMFLSGLDGRPGPVHRALRPSAPARAPPAVRDRHQGARRSGCARWRGRWKTWAMTRRCGCA